MASASGSDARERHEERASLAGQSGPQSTEAQRRQRLRSLAIAWALFALAVIFFLVTIVRLGANVANRPF
jgi:hypothetical protein